MDATTIELNEVQVSVENGLDFSSDAVYVSESVAQALHTDAWERLETQLVELNAVFNGAGTFKDEFDRVRQIEDAAEQVRKHANLIRSLTPITATDDE